MSATPTEEADRLLDEELARTGARDPREFYRERLRELHRRRPRPAPAPAAGGDQGGLSVSSSDDWEEF